MFTIILTQDFWNINYDHHWSPLFFLWFASAIRINDDQPPWSSTIIHDATKSVPNRRQGSIPWYQEFPQVPRSIRAIDPGNQWGGVVTGLVTIGLTSVTGLMTGWTGWTGWFGPDFLESSGQDPMNLMDEFCESMLKPLASGHQTWFAGKTVLDILGPRCFSQLEKHLFCSGIFQQAMWKIPKGISRSNGWMKHKKRKTGPLVS